MTCDEARRLYDTDPSKSTRAETAAWVAHMNSCKVCKGELVRKSNEMLARIAKEHGPLVMMLVLGDSIAKGATTYRETFGTGDPEV